jgi:hypothetical protein
LNHIMLPYPRFQLKQQQMSSETCSNYIMPTNLPKQDFNDCLERFSSNLLKEIDMRSSLRIIHKLLSDSFSVL